MAFELNTLHIFWYGEVQVIGTDNGEEVNKKVPTSSVETAAQAVVDDVYSKKPADNPAPNEYHAVTILNNVHADYTCKGNEYKGWRVPFEELDAALIDALVLEVLAIPE